MKNIEENSVTLEGRVETSLKFEYRQEDISFFCFTLAVKRPSGNIDYVPCLVSSHVIKSKRNWKNREIRIKGKLSYCIKLIEGRYQDEVQVNVLKIELINRKKVDANNVLLLGKIAKISKPPVTANTGRMPIDINILVEKANGRREFFPVVIWMDSLSDYRKIKKGMYIKLVGRIQVKEIYGRTICKVTTNGVEVVKKRWGSYIKSKLDRENCKNIVLSIY